VRRRRGGACEGCGGGCAVEGRRGGGRMMEGGRGRGAGTDGCGEMTWFGFWGSVHLKRIIIVTDVDDVINICHYI
jgi:hypothetical protein